MSNAPADGVANTVLDRAYHRRILIQPDSALVRVELEDDFHRLGVRLHHDGNRVTVMEGHASRVPWSTCPEALSRLQDFVGLALPATALNARSALDVHAYCTHLFDLASLALMHARAVTATEYDVTIEARTKGVRVATLLINGRRHWQWEVLEGRILGPDPFSGQALQRLPQWAAQTLGATDQEAAFVLRRALWIGRGVSGNSRRWLTVPFAADLGMPATCHTFSPQVAPLAARMPLHLRNFTQHPEQLLVDLRSGSNESSQPGKS